MSSVLLRSYGHSMSSEAILGRPLESPRASWVKPNDPSIMPERFDKYESLCAMMFAGEVLS